MELTPKELFAAGVHFGHQLRHWNPKSKYYIYSNRYGMSIIDLEKTHALLRNACEFVYELASNGKNILFIGTKKQSQVIIRESALKVDMPFCINRWLGGTLTNFMTIERSLSKYKYFLEMDKEGKGTKVHKKEASAMRREMKRMTRKFEGIQKLKEYPSALFIIDAHREKIAVKEANNLNIPVVALVDTNSDPSVIQYPIPGNDDNVKSICIIVEEIIKSIKKGISFRVKSEELSNQSKKIISIRN